MILLLSLCCLFEMIVFDCGGNFTLWTILYAGLIRPVGLAAIVDSLVIGILTMVVCHVISPFLLFYHMTTAQIRGGISMEAPTYLCAVAEATLRQNGRMKNKNAQSVIWPQHDYYSMNRSELSI